MPSDNNTPPAEHPATNHTGVSSNPWIAATGGWYAALANTTDGRALDLGAYPVVAWARRGARSGAPVIALDGRIVELDPHDPAQLIVVEHLGRGRDHAHAVRDLANRARLELQHRIHTAARGGAR